MPESLREKGGGFGAIAAWAAGAAAVFLIAGASATAAPPERSLKARLFFPPDRALLADREITIEGIVPSPGGEDLEIIVNGQDSYRVRIRRFTFSEEVRLEPGENTIQIGPEVHRVYCAASGEAPPPGFARVYGHLGLSDGCEGCHALSDEGAISLAGPREEVCSWCHNDMIAGTREKRFASVHAPVKAGECLRCHVAHTAANPDLLREKAPTCDECHAPVFEGLKKDRFVHGPLNLGDCRLCHTTHGSTEPGLLIRPATSLCTDCHSDVLPPDGTPAALAPHRMIPEGQCAKCHSPHSSQNPHLMRLPPGRLCQECHPGNTRSFHEASGFSIYICSKCHELHRPSMPHLIIDASRSLCTECHTRPEQPVSAHQAAREGRCFVCHTFHATSLATDIAAVCLRCHEPGPQLLAAHRGVAFTTSRCTACHAPHDSPLKKLLLPFAHTPFARRECASCHPAGESLAGPSLRRLCLRCHTALDLAQARTTPETIHRPFAEQDCSSCHTSHGALNPALLREPPIRLCLECHRELRKTTILRPTSSHGAFLKGACMDCHDSHFSPNAELLREPLETLCLKCHPGVAAPQGQPWQNPHPPAEEGRCLLCHRPHTSPLPRLLRPPAQRECRTCHEEFFESFESAANNSRHAPVKEGRCESCHQLHGSSGSALLKPGGRRDACQGCHSDWKNFHHLFSIGQLTEKAGGESANANGCLHCHRPHASTERKLLLPKQSRTCVGCHEH